MFYYTEIVKVAIAVLVLDNELIYTYSTFIYTLMDYVPSDRCGLITIT